MTSMPARPCRILVVDASDDFHPMSHASGAEWIAAPRVGLTRQRNDGVDWVAANWPAVRVAYFFDDDCRPAEDYFTRIESVWREEGRHAIGVGGRITEEGMGPHAAWWKAVLRLLGLWGDEGQFTRSGRNIPMVTHEAGVREVSWLHGGAMSYRVSTLLDLRFDETRAGYSWGEDFEFGARAQAHGTLLQDPTAVVSHLRIDEERIPRGRLYEEKTYRRWEWIASAQGIPGLSISRLWFLWSAVGEAFLCLLRAILKLDRSWFAAAIGVVRGMRRILWSSVTRDPV